MAENLHGEDTRDRAMETSQHDSSAGLLEDTLRPDRQRKENNPQENSEDSVSTKLPQIEFSDLEKQQIAKHYQNEILAHYEHISTWEKQKGSSSPREIPLRSELQKELDNNTWGVASENALAEFVEWLKKDALPQGSRELRAAGLKSQDRDVDAFTSDLNFTGEPRVPNKAEVFKIETLIDTTNRATEKIQQNVQELSYQRDLKRIGVGIPASWKLADEQDPSEYRYALRQGIAFHDRVYSAALMAYSLNRLGEHFELPAGVKVTEQQGKLDVVIDLPETLNQLSFDSRVSRYNSWVDSISNRLRKDDAALRAAGSNPFLNFSISNTAIATEVNEDGQFDSKHAVLDDNGKLVRFASSTETSESRSSADMSAHRFSAWRTEGSNPDSDVIAEITVQAQESRPGYDLLNKDIGDPFKLVQTLKADDPVVYNGKLINARELPELELKDKTLMAAQKATDIGWDLSMFASGIGTIGKIKSGASFIAEQMGKDLASELASKSTTNSLSGMNLAAIHAATETLMGTGGFLASNTWGEQNANWINSIRGTYFTANIFGSAASSRFNRIMHGTEEFQAVINTTAPNWLKKSSDIAAISMQVLTPISVAPMFYEAAKHYEENNSEQNEKQKLNPLIIESNAAAGLDTVASQDPLKARPGVMSLAQQSSILQATLKTGRQAEVMNALSNAGSQTPLRLLDNLYQEKIRLENPEKQANTNIWTERAKYFGNSYDDVLKSLAKFTREDSNAQAKASTALTYYFAKQLESSTERALSFSAQLAQISTFRTKIDEHKNDAETIEFKQNLDRLESESSTELAKYESQRRNSAQQLNQNLQLIRSGAARAKETSARVLTDGLETPISESNKEDATSTRINAAETLLLLDGNDTELREKVGKALAESVKLATTEQLNKIIDITNTEKLFEFTANTDAQKNILSKFPAPDESSNSTQAQALTIKIANLYPNLANEIKVELQSRLISILEHQSYSMGLPKLQTQIAEIAAQEKMTMLIPSLEKLSSNDKIPPQTRQSARQSLQILKEITSKNGDDANNSQHIEQSNPEEPNGSEELAESSKQLLQIEDVFPRLKTFNSEERNEFLKSNDFSLLIHDEFIKEAQRRVQSRWGKKSMLGLETKEDPQVTMRVLQEERDFQFKRLVDLVENAPIVPDESTKTKLECAKLTLAELAKNDGRLIESDRNEYILAVNHDAGQIAPYYFNESVLGDRNWHNEAAEALAQSAAAMPQQFILDAHILHSLLASKTNLNANAMSSLTAAWNKVAGIGEAPSARSIDKSLFRNGLKNLVEAIDSAKSKLQADYSQAEQAAAHAQGIYSKLDLAERRQQDHKELEAFNNLQLQIFAALASQKN